MSGGSGVTYKFGFNPDMDVNGSTDEDLIYQGGDAYFPESVVLGTDIEVSSTSTNDDSGGSGARTFQVIGLDANYYPQSETVSLAGTAVVNLANDYTRIFRASVITAGTANAAQGTITVADSNDTFLQVAPDYGQSLHGAFTVPANYLDSYLVNALGEVIGAAATTWVILTVEVRPFEGVWTSKDIMQINGETPLEHNYYPGAIMLPPKADVKLRGKNASGASLQVAGSFTIFHEAIRLNKYL